MIESLKRLAKKPISLVAPFGAVARRVVAAEFWIEHDRERAGDGPTVVMTEQADVQKPRDGAGPLNHRRYEIRAQEAEMSATALMARFCHNPNDFSPTTYAVFAPEPGPSGLDVGDRTTVHLPGPWDGHVVVTRRDTNALRLETLDGHMEAGWIEFWTRQDGSALVFGIESLARSGDEAFDALYHPGKIARLVQTEMWVSVLESAIAISGGRRQGRPFVETTVYTGADDE